MRFPEIVPRQRPLRLLAAACVLFVATGAVSDPSVETHEPRILVEAPSEVVVGEVVPFAVLLQERWGREGPMLPNAGVDRGARLAVATTDTLAELAPQLVLERSDAGRRRSFVTFRTPGVQRILVDFETGLSGRSNPIRVLPTPPATRVYWGDLHAHLHTPGAGHSGSIELDEYARLLAEGFAFARDGSLLDFAALTEHVQTVGGLAVPREDGRTPWDVIQQVAEAAQVPGQFITFPGFEWQGDEGDHCVIYPTSGPLDAPAEFAALARSVKARGALLTAHAVYLPTTFESDPRSLDGVEVTRDSKSTDWLGKKALAQGFVPAFLGCSDTHGGTLGATSLTGLRASALSREEVFRAVHERRTWATNGERIVLDFSVDASADVPRVRVRGIGTAPIDRIEIFRNGEPVAETHDLPATEEFEFLWEDADLLRLECVGGAITYHARVVQTSTNRYDPGERDLAISSPIRVVLTPRHFDSAHARRGGKRATSPGAALELLRAAWDRFRPAADRPLTADPPPDAAPTVWSDKDIAALRAAVADLEKLSLRDTTLTALSKSAAVLPDVAAAFVRVAAARARLRESAATNGPTAPLLESLRRDVSRARVAMEHVDAVLHTIDRAPLDRAWFAPRTLVAAHRALAEEMEAFMSRPTDSVPAVRGDARPTSRVTVPVDPRIALEVGAVPLRARELRAAMDRAWGYTSPSPAAGVGEPALRVRVVAEGNPKGGRVVGCVGGADVSLVASAAGWCAVLDRSQVPSPGDPPLGVEFAEPVRVNRVFLEGPRGAPLRRHGRVVAVTAEQAGDVARIVVQVDGGPVAAELVARPGGAAQDRVLWSGQIEVGARTLAFPAAALGDPKEARLRWGFGGWRRAGGVEVPGHDVARALGFGALADGRGAIALANAIVLVDPSGGETRRVEYPEGRSQGPGREFCTAPYGEGTIIRGADGPNGGWASLLSSSGEWKPVAPGPEAGTLAPCAEGGIAWVVGSELRRRGSDGVDVPPRLLDAPGRLIGIDPQGRVLLRVVSGETLRVDVDGRVVERISGPVLCADASGAALTMTGLDRRHAEIATGIRLERWLGDGSRGGPYTLAVRPSPLLDPPVLAAPVADGSILLLGGTPTWRRAPDHDWWGTTVERWEPVWVGDSPLQ